MFYLILILFLTIYYFWITNSAKSETIENTSDETYDEETYEEKEPEHVQLDLTEATYLNEDNESLDSLSNEVELGFRVTITIAFIYSFTDDCK